MKDRGPPRYLHLVMIAAVAVTWICFFRINQYAFQSTMQTARAHWIFLPAGVRLLAVLVFSEVGMFGIILGSWVTVAGTTNLGADHELVLACCSGIAPYLAARQGSKWMAIPESLAGLSGPRILVLSLLSAASNAILLNSYLWLSDSETGTRQIWAVFVGDFAGTWLVLALIAAVLSLAANFNRPGPR